MLSTHFAFHMFLVWNNYKMSLVNIVFQPPTMEGLSTQLWPEGGIKTGMCNSNIKNEAPRLHCTCLLENTSTSVEETGTAEGGGRVSHVPNRVCVIDLEKDLKVTSQTYSSFFFFLHSPITLQRNCRRFYAWNLSPKKIVFSGELKKNFHLVLITSIRLSCKTSEAQESTSCFLFDLIIINDGVLRSVLPCVSIRRRKVWRNKHNE